MSASGEGHQPALHCGFVALCGWTNVGKSTLLNRLVGDKLAAVSAVPQTTRFRITGAITVAGRGQIVFVDTPGLHRPRYRMNRNMVEVARKAAEGVDLAALVVDAARGLGEGDRQAFDLLVRTGIQRIMILNKIDRVRPKSRLLPMIEEATASWGLPEVFPVSALTGDGCEALRDRLFELLPAGSPLYPEDFLTDQTERALASEWIREKLLELTRQEVPHAAAVVVERWEEKGDGLVVIHASILVDRESQKQIVIGAGGRLLKQIGTAARRELEALLDRRVYLELWVRVRPDWRNDERVLRDLGLS